MYQFGLGIPQDLALSKRLYQRSIELDPSTVQTPITIVLHALAIHKWFLEFPPLKEIKSRMIEDLRTHVLILCIIFISALLCIRPFVVRRWNARLQERRDALQKRKAAKHKLAESSLESSKQDTQPRDFKEKSEGLSSKGSLTETCTGTKEAEVEGKPDLFSKKMQDTVHEGGKDNEVGDKAASSSARQPLTEQAVEGSEVQGYKLGGDSEGLSQGKLVDAVENKT